MIRKLIKIKSALTHVRALFLCFFECFSSFVLCSYISYEIGFIGCKVRHKIDTNQKNYQINAIISRKRLHDFAESVRKR